jgi:hypothetical protein
LRKAVQKDRSWASRAVTDIEFDKYRTSSDFADIIK